MNAVDFVKDIVSALAGDEAVVTVYPSDDELGGCIIHVSVGGAVPSVIGRNGKTIDAIRVVAKALGYEGSYRVQVRINEH